MNVTCPHCQSRYLLPPSLMGPGGARVRCPRCEQGFVVTAAGEVTAAAEPAALEADPAPEVLEPPSPAMEAPLSPAEAPMAEPAVAHSDFSGAQEARPNPAPAEGPLDIARRVLAALDSSAGPEIARAAGDGRLLSQFGTRLMEAWDEYRQEAGRAAGPAPFREALRERWGMDLNLPVGVERH